ncbi:MAG: 8-amino-7-oxononanoate synthase [bacterium]
METLDTHSQKRLEDIKDKHLYRRLRTIRSSSDATVKIEGKKVFLLCSNNYLGLSTDPYVTRITKKYLERYGTGTGASRLISGNLEILELLEEKLSRLKYKEKTLLYPSGYMANIGAITAIAGAGDVIFSDRLNHASIIDGCRLSRARTIIYEHSEMNDLERKIRDTANFKNRIIITDSIFSMDGDMAPLMELAKIKEKYGAWLVVDDAHGTGAMGRGGAGVPDLLGVGKIVDIIVGTLSKALASQGGFISASENFYELLINTSRPFIYSTGLSPVCAAAALAALQVIEKNPRILKNLKKNTELLHKGLIDTGFHLTSRETHITSVIIGDSKTAVEFSDELFKGGVYAPAIRPPTVEEGRSRIRITAMATHNEEDIEFALKVFHKVGTKFGLIPKKYSGISASEITRTAKRREPRGIFITATDTGVGKTIITASLARCLTEQGLNVGVMKPVMTGASPDDPQSDTSILLRLSGVSTPIELATPLWFEEPLSPYAASINSTKKFSIDEILSAYRELQKMHDFVVVEGIGGVLVPLTEGFTVRELIRAMDLPALVVARAGLGTLNHTLLTLESLRNGNIAVRGVVLNTVSSEPDASFATNAKVLSSFLNGVPVYGIIQYIDKPQGHFEEVYETILPIISEIGRRLTD